jgi:hypothetical protein
MNTHPEPEQLSAYVDGELTGTDRDDLEQHLTGCSECSSTLRALRATLADMRALPQPVPSEQETWALRGAITKARRKPAQRYALFAKTLGTAAAVAAVLVLSITFLGRTASSTFSRTATDVEGGVAAAPQAGPTTQPLFLTDSTNFTADSAKNLLASFATTETFGATAPTSNQAQGGTTHSGSSKTALSADQSRYATEITNCENIVLSKGSGGARAIAYIVGRYESTPVFFLIYSVSVSGKTKTEMWVVRQSDCYIRLFLAPR